MHIASKSTRADPGGQTRGKGGANSKNSDTNRTLVPSIKKRRKIENKISAARGNTTLHTIEHLEQAMSTVP